MRILSPESRVTIPLRPAAPRLEGLAGARIGLLDNGKSHADRLLAAVGVGLVARYHMLSPVVAVKPNAWAGAEPRVREALAGVSAVVTALAD